MKNMIIGNLYSSLIIKMHHHWLVSSDTNFTKKKLGFVFCLSLEQAIALCFLLSHVTKLLATKVYNY